MPEVTWCIHQPEANLRSCCGALPLQWLVLDVQVAISGSQREWWVYKILRILWACCILADPVYSIKVQWNSGKQIQGTCLHAPWFSWNLIPFWSCDLPTNCKAWHIRLQLGWLLAINGFFAHSAARISKTESFYFFCLLYVLASFSDFSHGKVRPRICFTCVQLCVPSEFRPKVGPNPSFLSGSSNIYISI